MNNRRLAFVYSPLLESLSYPPDCPFKTQRARLTRERLLSFGLLGCDQRFEFAPQQASLADLCRFHTPRYLDELQRAADGDLTIEGLHMGLGGQDTPIFKDVFEYGAWACGASLGGASLLLAGRADIAFNLMGGFHHAGREKAAGFCYLNDVVLACQKLTDAGVRVACVDVDAHHGDGTQEAFYRRADVLTVSMHETGATLFPWGGFENETGEGDGLGFNLNVPLPAGTYDEAFLMAFERVVMPSLLRYQADVIVLELGMDTLAGDPLTHLHMTNNMVVDVLERLMYLNRPMLVVGGGGYHVEHTVRAWALAWRTCAGEGDEDVYSMGLGGVMLGSSEWAGGLRDRQLPITAEQRAGVEPALRATLGRFHSDHFRNRGSEMLFPAGPGAVPGG